MLDVCLLGTGGMMPLPDRWLTALLVRYNGKMILIDCGEGTQIPVKMAGWGFKAIEAILFTHYHADHIAGLPGLLLTLGNSGRTEPLVLAGPPGLKKVVAGLTVISPELPYDLKLVELPENEKSDLCIKDIFVKAMPVHHNITCLSYSIEIKRQGKFDPQRARDLNIPLNCWNRLQKGEAIEISGKLMKPEMVLGEPREGIKVCYCTDTRPSNEIVKFVKDSDLFICEGMYGDEDDAFKAVEKRHMTFKEAGIMAKQANVAGLWLTHYSPSLTEPQQYVPTLKTIFENAVAGTDLLKKTIKYQQD